MRRGGRARRAMLGAVATGALLGAAQGFNLGWKSLLASATAQSDGEAGGYTGRAVSVSSWGNRLAVGEAKADESKSQVSAEMSPVHRRRLAERLLSQVPTIDFVPNEATFNNTYDGTYTVVTAAGLEIEIDSTSVAGVYTIASIGPSTNGDGFTIEVAGATGGDPSACTSDITLDLNAGEITCTVAGSEGGNTEYTNLRTADESTDVPVSDCAGDGGTLAVDQDNNVITCSVPDEAASTRYTVRDGSDGVVDLASCTSGIDLDDDNGKITKITCNVAGTQDVETTYTKLKTDDGSQTDVLVSACADGGGSLSVDQEENANGVTGVTCTVPAGLPAITTYTNLRTAADSTDVPVSDCAVGGGTLAVDQATNVITCNVAATQDVETTYTKLRTDDGSQTDVLVSACADGGGTLSV